MKRGPNSSLGNVAKRVKTFEGQELRYKKSGDLDMRFSLSKKYIAHLNNASYAGPPCNVQTKPDSGNRGHSLPPVYTKGVWKSTDAPTEATIMKKGAGGDSSNFQSKQGRALRNRSNAGEADIDVDEDLHYTKSGNLDMRYSSSRRHLEKTMKRNASYQADACNATRKEVVQTPQGHSLSIMPVIDPKETLVLGTVTPDVGNVQYDAREQPQTGNSDPVAEVEVKSPMVIIENDIPSSVPMTKNNIPDMRKKTARDWVEEQAKKHAGFKNPMIPSWIPRQKDGTMDFSKKVVQVYLSSKQKQTSFSILSTCLYDPDSRVKYYEKKLKQKGNFYFNLKAALKENIPDLHCILLDASSIVDSLTTNDMDDAGQESPARGSEFSDDDFKIPTYIPKLDYDTLKDTIWDKKKNRIGSGAFGVVYKGKLHGEDVAIKKLFMNPINSRDQESFVNELTILAALSDHPNLVKLCGYTVHPATIVMEYIQLGSLNQLLYFCEDDYVEAKLCDPRIKKRIICSIVYGMRQLHEVGIIHYDLKPANILITNDFSAKITDFGLSRCKVKTTSLIGSHIRDDGENNVAGTAAYMAPELIRDSHSSIVKKPEKVDVYSFGILLNEIVHEEEPYVRDYEKLRGKGPFAAVDHASKGYRPFMNTELVKGALFFLIVSSWNTFTQDRMEFKNISDLVSSKEFVVPSLVDLSSHQLKRPR